MTPERPGDLPAPRHTPESAPAPPSAEAILRFQRTERLLHWALAIPFLLLYASALGLALTGGDGGPSDWRAAFAGAHRAVGVLMIALPVAALLFGGSLREHFENLREGWNWTRDDVRWLLLAPRASLDARVKLPPSGKFNAAEKLNFMMVSATWPFYVVTGLLVWTTGAGAAGRVAHLFIALVGLPLVLWHVTRAVLNPARRAGLNAMLTGWVDRKWARRHYAHWYHERIEAPERKRAAESLVGSLSLPSQVRCPRCSAVNEFGSWRELIGRAFRVEPLFCPACASELPIAEPGPEPRVADAILAHLERSGGREPFAPSRGPDA